MEMNYGAESLQFTSYYAEAQRDPTLDRSVRRGGSFGIEALRSDMAPYQATFPALPEFQIGMGLTKDAVANWNYGDGWLGPTTAQPGSIIVIPPHTAVEYDVRDSHELLHIACSADTLENMLEPFGLNAATVFNSLTKHRFIYDMEIKIDMLEVWKHSNSADPASGMLVDAHWQKIIAALLRRADEEPTFKSYGLTKRHVQTITTFLRENIAMSLATKDLADLIDLPISQFSKDFKAATGLSPYQFILKQRLLAAQDALAQGTGSLAEIAMSCGFSSQSHMTDVFREKLGCTPGKFRTAVSA